jgi:hypothetical protein
MKTIEIEMPIPSNDHLTIPLPPAIEPGDAVLVRFTAVVDEDPDDLTGTILPLHDIGVWPDLPLRREEMYGDDGR